MGDKSLAICLYIDIILDIMKLKVIKELKKKSRRIFGQNKKVKYWNMGVV